MNQVILTNSLLGCQNPHMPGLEGRRPPDPYVIWPFLTLITLTSGLALAVPHFGATTSSAVGYALLTIAVMCSVQAVRGRDFDLHWRLGLQLLVPALIAFGVTIGLRSPGAAASQRASGNGSHGIAGSPVVVIRSWHGKWDSLYTNSNWWAYIAWDTLGDVRYCTLRDDKQSPAKVVSSDSGNGGREFYPYGPYKHDTLGVRVYLHCVGSQPALYDDESALVLRPKGPRAKIILGAFVPGWLNPQHTRWQLRISWYSTDAIDCNIYDNWWRHWAHRDHTGERNDPYGNFSATEKSVTVTLACLNVTGIRTEQPITVRSPAAS